MKFLFLITTVFFAIWEIKNILYWVWLWQLKEYRFDRMLIHLKETRQGRSLLFSPMSVVKWFALIAFVSIAFNERFLSVYQMIIFFVFLIQFFILIKDFLKKQIRLPVFTAKASLIVALSFAAAFLLYSLPFIDPFPWLLLIDKLIPIIIAIIIFSFSFPTELFRDFKAEKAMRKLAKFKDVLVIGVTGSYGKSSTKDYIAQILSNKFNVVKTLGTNNTPIGIANTILEKINKNTEIFVIEMGAYKRGEIAEMCQIVDPRIGVLTAVNTQHLSLFRSLQNTMRAKYELIEALPKNGLALFNGNNENVYKLYKKQLDHGKKVLYFTNSKYSNKHDYISASNIIVEKNSVTFDVELNGDTLSLKAPLIGKHQIENVLPAIYLAKWFGMKKEEIRKAVSSLSPLSKTMTIKEINNIFLIDDSFNANPQAVLVALDYMKIYKNKKMIVLQPMIELGKKAKEEHYRVAREISRYCDYLFLTNKNFFKSISKGIRDGEGNCVLQVGKPKELADFIFKNSKSEDVVLFEGKESAFALKILERKF